MPKLALLSGADPRLVNLGPVVQLKPGKWEIETDIVDSGISIRLDDQDFWTPILSGFIVEAIKTITAQIRISVKGKESHITVFAKWLST